MVKSCSPTVTKRFWTGIGCGALLLENQLNRQWAAVITVLVLRIDPPHRQERPLIFTRRKICHGYSFFPVLNPPNILLIGDPVGLFLTPHLHLNSVNKENSSVQIIKSVYFEEISGTEIAKLRPNLTEDLFLHLFQIIRLVTPSKE